MFFNLRFLFGTSAWKFAMLYKCYYYFIIVPLSGMLHVADNFTEVQLCASKISLHYKYLQFINYFIII